jgi:Big-like domain-containing protein
MGGRGRVLRIIAAVTLTVAAWGPASFTLGAGVAHASSCTPFFSCAPSNVNFLQQGSYNLGGVHVCGIEGQYAPLASSEIDRNYDDPYNINNTNEGNYPDSEAIQFQPNSSNPGDEIYPGSTIAIDLPHPAESYPLAGSILPPAYESTAATYEQSHSTVTLTQVFFGSNPEPEFADISVTLAGQGAGAKVRLDAFSPYNPPAVQNAPGPNVSGGGTSANILNENLTTGHYVSGQVALTDVTGTAYFQIQDSQSEDVVFGATDVTSSTQADWLGITQTATVPFNAGSTYTSSDYCQPSQTVAPSAPTGDGFTYILLQNGGPYNNIGYVIPDVTVSSASGIERAVFTVPTGFPTTTGEVTLIVLDAISPPGQGTPNVSLPNPEPYPSDDFSVTTSEDPVPGYPSAGNTPTFQADASSNIPEYPVDPFGSPLTTSAATAQVGPNSTLTATALLSDVFNNPVNGKQVSVFQSSTSTHAGITPETPPTQTENPETGKDGTVTFTIGDSCAETVNLEATDMDDGLLLQDPYQVPVQFTPAPPVPPDGTTTPTTCGVPSTHSQVTVSVDSVVSGPGVEATAPSDGSTQATVTVTLGDQFGNADSCQQIVLAPEARTAHTTITPLDPTNPCPGDNLPGFSGSDGVAQFNVSDNTAEQVVLGVADTTVIAIWPSSATADPLDVADINFLGGSATQSTVVASPTTAPADGQPASTVTVTLKNANGQVLKNKNVTLAGCTNDPTPGGSCTADPTSAISPTTVTTDVNGEASFGVADSSTSLPHVVYYQATDSTDGVIVNQIGSVTFMRGGASLSANPTTVVGDGIGTSTLTFTLQDTGGNPVSGVSVSLAANPSTGVSVSAPTSTNGAGTATFTVSSTSTGPVTFTATATYSSPPTACLGVLSAGTCTVKALVKVSFISPPKTFTITATPSANIPADGITPSQVTVTALDPNGVPIGGLPVTLAGAGSASGSPEIAPSSAVTGATGQAVFSVTDATAETVTLSATYQEIGVPSSPSFSGTGCTGSLCTTTIGFVPTESEVSTVVPAPSSAPADGHSAITVTVTLTSGSGNPLNGHAVVLTTGSATTNVTPSNIGGTTGLSGPGIVSFTVTDTKPETLTLYARDESTGAIINQMPTVSFVPTEVQLSTVLASPTSLPAGGPPGVPSTTTVTVTIIGPGCTAGVSGHTVKLTTPSGTANISPAVPTDSGGVATFSVSDTLVETIVLTATDTTCGNTLGQPATVMFTASEANQSTVLPNPISTPAAGPGSTLSVILKTASGAPITGHLVTVPAVAHAKVTPLAYPGFAAGVTNNTGLVQFAITDATVEAVTLAAFDGATQLNQVATISFTAGESNQSSLTAPVTSLPAGGPPTTVTLTLHAGGGAVIAGDVVSLSATSPTNSVATITPATATTNPAGQAQFTVGDARVQTVTLTALDRTTGVTVVQTVVLNFTATEQNQSTVSANPTVLKVKKGSTITVTLLGSTGAPLAGHTVMLTTGSKTTKVTIITKHGVTSATGQIQFTLTDTAPQVLTIVVTDTTGGVDVTLYMSITVTFLKA